MTGIEDQVSNTSGPASGADPSMEEILASIRRILKEDETGLSAKIDLEDDVLLLDASMMTKSPDLGAASLLPENSLAAAHPAAPVTAYHYATHMAAPTLAPEPEAAPVVAPAQPPAYTAPSVAELPADPAADPDSYNPPEPAMETTMPENIQPPHGLISGEASEAAASSIGALVRSISNDRSVAISRGGPTIEDIVREEIRPMLKSWLDTHLPTLVDRIVRTEIERVIERTQG